MNEGSDGFLRIFWPNNITRTIAPGVIVGWRNSELDLFVITVLEDVEVRSVETALKVTGTLFRDSPYPVARIFQLCDRSQMHVLGTLNHPRLPEIFDPKRICAFTLTGAKRPYIYCPPEANLSVQIIMFDPPNPTQMQYMSLEPISLALGNDGSSLSRSPDLSDELEQEHEYEKARVAQLVAKLKFHAVIRHSPSKQDRALPSILQQINCAQEVADLLQKNTPLVGPRRKRSLSVSERVVESAQSLYTFTAWSLWTLFMTYAYPALVYVFKIAIIGHRVVAEIILQILEFKLPFRRLQMIDKTRTSQGGVALKDISACCQQVHLRLQQFSYYPAQYSLLQKRHGTWSSFPTTNSDYIRFYNSLWLVANDVIIGIALGSFINDNAQATSQFVGAVLDKYTIEGLKRMIRWLMSYPGGLKLNTELAAFLGDLFLWVIEYWSSTTVMVILPRLPTIVYVIGFSSFAGASMPIAIFSDLLSLMTIHIYSFYVASARIFNWQLTIIISLFHLFRGKKRNVLRNRIDNCDYDLDQLLLGTILFTLLFFLLPTVVVFYLTFASARMAIISLKATLDTWLACLNHFPLFALMLRIKDSKRLPGGLHFELLKAEPIQMSARREILGSIDEEETPEFLAEERPRKVDVEGGNADEDPETAEHGEVDEDEEGDEDEEPAITLVSYIQLSSTPLSLRHIFEQYYQLWARIHQHYLSPNVAFRLLTGRFVPPLGRSEMYGLQYSVLPRERASVGAVWKILSDSPPVKPDKGGPVSRGWNGPLAVPGRAIGKQWK